MHNIRQRGSIRIKVQTFSLLLKHGDAGTLIELILPTCAICIMLLTIIWLVTDGLLWIKLIRVGDFLEFTVVDVVAKTVDSWAHCLILVWRQIFCHFYCISVILCKRFQHATCPLGVHDLLVGKHIGVISGKPFLYSFLVLSFQFGISRWCRERWLLNLSLIRFDYNFLVRFECILE